MRIVLLAVLLSGCVIESGQRLDATWSIERLEAGAAACPASWETAVLVTSTPDRRIETAFPCSDGGGQSAVLPDGTYTASIEFRDRNDAVVAASLEERFDSGGWNSLFEPTVYLDAGYVSASWSWGADQRWCSDSWNPFQEIHMTITGPTSLTQLYSCEQDGGLSVPLLAGTYEVSIGQGFSGHSLGAITVTAPNHVTVLPVAML